MGDTQIVNLGDIPCNNISGSTGTFIDNGEILNVVKNIYNKNCDINISKYDDDINDILKEQVDNLEININKSKNLDLTNLVLISVLIIFLLVIIVKLYGLI